MLTSKERAELRSQATTIDTTLMVGKGGVTEAVKAFVGGAFDFSSVQIAGLNRKNVNLLKAYGKTGKSPVQFIEVMACDGGCISGPSSHATYEAGRKTFNDKLLRR